MKWLQILNYKVGNSSTSMRHSDKVLNSGKKISCVYLDIILFVPKIGYLYLLKIA